MRCDEVRDNLVALTDGELTPEERDRLESHLANCPECRRERADLASTGDLLQLISGREESRIDFAGAVLAGEQLTDAWCSHIRKELVAFEDGELSESEQRPVREHLAECADCTAEHRALGEADRLLDRWTVPSFDVDLLARIPIEKAPVKRGGKLLRWLPATVAAACILVLATIFTLRSDPNRSEPTPPEPSLYLNLDVLESLDRLDRAGNRDVRRIVDDLEWDAGAMPEYELALWNGGGH